MIERYDWPGGSEALLRFGPAAGPVVAMALPPFEEGNRTRALAAAVLRALAAVGIGGILPDLPGQGESERPTEAATLADWRAAFAHACAAEAGPVVVAAIRAGALVADAGEAAVGTWRLAPQDGDALIRELARAHALSGGRLPPAGDDGPPVRVLGNRIGRPFLDELRGRAVDAERPHVRTVRLGSDPRPADHRIDAAPPWRAAEPHADRALAAALADDLAGWVRTCAG